MSTALFIARRIYHGNTIGQKEASRPASLISVTGIAVGLAVMLISVFVIIGFKREVTEKVAGFTSHLQVTTTDAASLYRMTPLNNVDSLAQIFEKKTGINHVQRYSLKPGMIKTENAFQGMMLKGLGAEYDTTFLAHHLVEGRLPDFNDLTPNNAVVISKTMADKLKLHIGDQVDTYYMQQNVRARRLQVVAIYETNIAEYDNTYLLTDIALVNRLNKWTTIQASGLEVNLSTDTDLEETTWALADELGGQYSVRNMEQLNPQLFSWLGVLDMNIWVILALMTGVAGFTIVSGLLIIIIERTQMIGVLKAMGAPSELIRRVFLWLSVFLIGRGMMWGNVIALLLYVVQKHTGILRLDPNNYYMDTVPLGFNLLGWLLLNAGTLVVAVLMLVGPSCLIARIKPSEAVSFD